MIRLDNALWVINAGSSSLKFQIFEVASQGPERRLRGKIGGIGTGHPRFVVQGAEDQTVADVTLTRADIADLAQAQEFLSEWLEDNLGEPPLAVGHRIVHGGPNYAEAALITPAVLADLMALASLAPLHQKNNLLPVQRIAARWPDLPQVACFDTAFHRGHAPEVERFALPEALYQQGVRRYGFHGLSYAYVARHLQEQHSGRYSRVIAAHLGSGASACALRDGLSVESTMGFTALDGLPMGTRPGRLDAGVVLWLLEQGMSHDDIQHLLYQESGLLGVSGISADVRDLEASDKPRARLALELFAYRTAESVAGLGVALGGLDALVFTAGIGENRPWVRQRVCEHLAWLGVTLDDAANQAQHPIISSAESAVDVLVIRTDEERMIAEQTWGRLRAG